MNRQTLKMTREQEILSSLNKLGFATRSQLQRIHNLGGVRNANRILNNMSPYLNSFREGAEKVYYLNKKGAEQIGSDKVLAKSQNYTHTLMRNDLYIHFNLPQTWRNEVTVTVPNKIKIRMDARFDDSKGVPVFVEVDNLQKMIENEKKIEHYKQLKDLNVLQRKFGTFPPIVWVTTTELRKDIILKLSEQFGLRTEVYLREELQ